MTKQQVAVVCGLALLCQMVSLCSASPVNDQPDTATELGPFSFFNFANSRPTLSTTTTTTPPTTTTTTTTTTSATTTIPRDKNPIYNVWEFAKTHDGPINTRAAQPESAEDAGSHANQGNQCMWAIVSCCNAETAYRRDNCFEELGCAGAWFQNLCSQEYIDIANSRVANIFSSGFGKK